MSASMRMPDHVVIRGGTLSDLLRTHAEAHVGPEATPERRRFLPPGTDLSDVQLSSTKLAWADLREVCLSSADLSDADLTLANLSGVDLRDAILKRATLTGAIMSGAKL